MKKQILIVTILASFLSVCSYIVLAETNCSDGSEPTECPGNCKEETCDGCGCECDSEHQLEGEMYLYSTPGSIWIVFHNPCDPGTGTPPPDGGWCCGGQDTFQQFTDHYADSCGVCNKVFTRDDPRIKENLCHEINNN